MKRIVSILLLISFFTFSCYNTYYIPRGELLKIQSSEEEVVVVTAIDNKPVQIKNDTRLFVRSAGGKRYQLTPFNFKITESQLVASDRDYLLALDGLKEYGEVDHVSTWKTALLIGGGAGVVAGLIIVVILTSGKKSWAGEE